MNRRLAVPLLILLVFAGVVGVWACIGFLPATNRVPGFDFSANGTTDLSKPGVFGDSFGWVNSLFSALAFAGVLVTLWMQRTELQLQREEMRLSREEQREMVKAQQESENRLFLTAYMNALESLRQLSQWRMTADPARTKYATFPVVHGLVMQARVIQSLHSLIHELEPEIRRLHPSLQAVADEGSFVWTLEKFLSIHLSLRAALERFRGTSDDTSQFTEAENIIRLQLNDLEAMKKYVGTHRQRAIDDILVKAPSLKWLVGDILADNLEAREARKRFLHDIEKTNEELLSLVMSMCFEN